MEQRPPGETPTINAEAPAAESFASLEAAMADYLQRLERGEQPDPNEYLRAHPGQAAELRNFFRNHHWLGKTPAPLGASLAGTLVGPYEIEGEIARGGMGVVYRARQQGLKRAVALKLISSGVLASEQERRRFRSEAEAAARLHHPGIIAIHEIGSWQGYEYYSMALVEGPTLQRRIDDQTFDHDTSARLVRDIARAVDYAHRAGIVHRDLKPENILICEDGRPLVTDFGLAKWHREGTMLTRTGQVIGTPHYMSPEQACGRCDVGAEADIYALGAILYALLTGRPPHIGSSAAEVLRSVLQDEPAAPRQIRRDVPLDLEKVCLKAIDYEPSKRYESAESLALDLERYLAGEPTSAAGSGLLDRMAREIRRDQHQTHFEDWGRTLTQLGMIIFVGHVTMFVLHLAEYPQWLAFWAPRAVMMAAVFVAIYRARAGSLLPRSVAERPVWSIWLGYLAALGTINLLAVTRGIDYPSQFPIAAALSGFGFIAMSGHVWGGSALLGFGFLAVALLTTWSVDLAPLWFGGMWLISLLVLARHYRTKRPGNNG
jgi:predicted Ser/Thr protein kinase